MIPGTNSLRLLFWETTAACNLRCRHCRRIDALAAAAGDELSTEEGFKLIDRVSEFAKPILVFSGGEPLVRTDIFQLIERAKMRGLRVALASNGLLIDSKTASKIREAELDRVSISLDGARAATHDSFRGLPGSHGRAVEAVSMLRALEVGTQINFTVARHNVSEVPEIYELAIALGVNALHYFMLVPVGCGLEVADKELLTSEEYERWLEWLWARSREGQIELKATCAPHYFRVARQQESRLPKAKRAAAAKAAGPLHQATRGCLAGTAVAFVSHRGEVFPCGYFPVPAGNVRELDFRDIWEKSGIFLALRDPGRLKGKCGACPYRFICGGCRARAYGMTGDWLAEEPFCLYSPSGEKKLV